MRILSYFSFLLLVFSLSSSSVIADTRTGTSPIGDNLLPVTTPDTTVLSDALAAQRTGIVLPPSENGRTNTPLPGEIIVPGDDEYGYYVLLGDEDDLVDNLSLEVIFSAPQQDPIVIGEDIVVTQTVSVQNIGNESFNTTLNLWNYAGAVEEELLTQFASFNVSYENNTLGEQAIFSLALAVNETKLLDLTYTYPGIVQTVTCQEQSLADLLPPGATIKETDLPLDTALSQECTVDLENARPEILFTPITINLEDYPQLEGLVGLTGENEVIVQDNKFTLSFQEEER